MADIAQKAINANSQKEGTRLTITPHHEIHSTGGKVVAADDGIADANDRFDTKFTGWTKER